MSVSIGMAAITAWQKSSGTGAPACRESSKRPRLLSRLQAGAPARLMTDEGIHPTTQREKFHHPAVLSGGRHGVALALEMALVGGSNCQWNTMRPSVGGAVSRARDSRRASG